MSTTDAAAGQVQEGTEGTPVLGEKKEQVVGAVSKDIVKNVGGGNGGDNLSLSAPFLQSQVPGKGPSRAV